MCNPKINAHHLDTTKQNILKEIEVLDNQDDNSDLKDNSNLKRMDLVSQLRVLNNKMDYILCQ